MNDFLWHLGYFKIQENIRGCVYMRIPLNTLANTVILPSQVCLSKLKELILCNKRMFLHVQVMCIYDADTFANHVCGEHIHYSVCWSRIELIEINLVVV